MSHEPLRLHLWDDARARTFEPFALTRPVSELLAGATLIRHRWEALAGGAASGFVAGPHLTHFQEAGTPAASTELPAGALVANARMVPSLGATRLGDDVSRVECGGRLAAVRLAGPISVTELMAAERLEELPIADGGELSVGGRWLERVWELIGTLPDQLTEDIAALAPTLSTTRPSNAVILGDHPVLIEDGAEVEPLVCFDASAGPVLVRRGATVAAFSRVVGPCVIGERSMVLGGKVAAASIGERCKVNGEVSNVVFLGHANKSHDGFVGYSYLGRWVNIGASTVTSNLKNTYGTVTMWTPEGVRDTGMQFLGTLFGDHVKTGIGTRLDTGSLLGACANVFGSEMPPKVVPPFAWGNRPPFDLYDLERFLRVAERVMHRRDVELTADARQQLCAAHAARWEARTS